RLIKKGGAWPWVGTVTRTSDLILAAAALSALVGIGWLYHRIRRPPTADRWWERGGVLLVLACMPIAGWIVLAALRTSRPRKARAALQAVLALAGLLVFAFITTSTSSGDTWGIVAVGMIGAALSWALVAARLLLAPASATGARPAATPTARPAAVEPVTSSEPRPQRTGVPA